ncbi:MAG: cyclase family protein [Clostridiales bacterium]|nr:cyclase family protein [Clostridiales bacterium]
MKIYDISMKIHFDMPVYRGKTSKRPVQKIERDYSSGTVYETKLELNMHTGTHIDRSLHFLQGGDTIDKLDLEKVVIKCQVLDFTNADEKITKEHLMEKSIEEGDFILLKTKNSTLDILEDEFVYLDKTGADYLKKLGVRGVGIDALGIERSQPNHETHKILLGAGIVILEGLRLKEVEEGEYLLVAAPINIVGAEAAPVRAILIDDLSQI